MYSSNRINTTVCRDTLSQPLTTNTGCVQGSISGPGLFAAFIDALLLLLDNYHVNKLAYVDDVCIYCPYAHVRDFRQVIQPALDAISEWREQNNMKPSPSKTQVVLYGESPGTTADLTLAGSTIGTHSTAKFLGCDLDHELNLRGHYARVISKGRNKLSSIRALSYGPSAISGRTIKLLTTLFVTSVLGYCSGPLLACLPPDCPTLQAVDSFIAEVSACCLGLPRRVNRVGLSLESGIPTALDMRDAGAASLYAAALSKVGSDSILAARLQDGDHYWIHAGKEVFRRVGIQEDWIEREAIDHCLTRCIMHERAQRTTYHKAPETGRVCGWWHRLYADAAFSKCGSATTAIAYRDGCSINSCVTGALKCADPDAAEMTAIGNAVEYYCRWARHRQRSTGVIIYTDSR